jgi:hypothetical protein
MDRSLQVGRVLIVSALLLAAASAQAASRTKAGSTPAQAPQVRAKCETTYVGSRIRIPTGKCGATGYQWRSISGDDLYGSGALPGSVIRAYPRG